MTFVHRYIIPLLFSPIPLIFLIQVISLIFTYLVHFEWRINKKWAKLKEVVESSNTRESAL